MFVPEGEADATNASLTASNRGQGKAERGQRMPRRKLLVHTMLDSM